MTERMHPQDLRSIMSAVLAGGALADHTSTGIHEEVVVQITDRLLAHVERTAKPEPLCKPDPEACYEAGREDGAREERERIANIFIAAAKRNNFEIGEVVLAMWDGGGFGALVYPGSIRAALEAKP